MMIWEYDCDDDDVNDDDGPVQGWSLKCLDLSGEELGWNYTSFFSPII